MAQEDRRRPQERHGAPIATHDSEKKNSRANPSEYSSGRTQNDNEDGIEGFFQIGKKCRQVPCDRGCLNDSARNKNCVRTRGFNIKFGMRLSFS